MKRKNLARNALFTSVLSLLLCVSMLVGTTFAWFTDEVVSGNNVIAAGNLNVELYHSNKKDAKEPVAATTELFDEVTNNLWEPGALAYENFEVVNAGSLALKYKMGLMALEQSVVNGYKLGDVIKVGFKQGGFTATTRDDLIAEVTEWKSLTDFSLNKNGVKLLAGGTDTFGLVLYWAPNDNATDNKYNVPGEALKLNVGIELYATQDMNETDSFDDTYDVNAEYPGVSQNPNEPQAPTFTVSTATQLQAAMTPTVSNDELKIVLTQNIELATGETWTPLNLDAYNGTVRNIVIDGQGYTIKGLNAPLIGHAYFGNTSIEIKNLTLTDVKIEQGGYNGMGLGAFVGAADSCDHVKFINCHLVDSTITCTDKVTGVGGIIGYSSSPLTMTNCSVTNTTVTGNQHSAGAIIGHTYASTITNAKVVGCTITGERVDKSGYVVGTVNANTTITTSAECAGNTVFDVADSTAIYGRIVGATLTLNGTTLP